MSILNKHTAIACVLSLILFHVSDAFSMSPESSQTSPQVREISQENLVYMQLDTGLVVIELAPFMAPRYVQRFTSLVTDGYYNGLDFYRVIDGFVAQAGDITGARQSPWKTPFKDELSRPATPNSDFAVVQSPDFFADATGFINGFAAGRDDTAQQEWLLHCYGVVALARNVEINTGSTDFYINIGHAPRFLDRNMTVFGRVIYGMDNVQKIQRPEFGSGDVIDDVKQRTQIISATVGSNLPAEEQLHFIQDTFNSDAFQQRLVNVKNRSNEFFVHKGNGNIDACYVKPRIKLKSNEKD